MAETRDTRDGTGYVASDCAGPIRACRVCSATTTLQECATTLQECATLCGAPFCLWGGACDGSISARFSPTVRYTSMNCSPWLTAPGRKCMGDDRSIATEVVRANGLDVSSPLCKSSMEAPPAAAEALKRYRNQFVSPFETTGEYSGIRQAGWKMHLSRQTCRTAPARSISRPGTREASRASRSSRADFAEYLCLSDQPISNEASATSTYGRKSWCRRGG